MKLLILTFVACIAAAVMAVIVAEEIQRHRSMVKALPPYQPVAPHEIDAMLREGYPLVAVLGTGSMQPYIPAGEGRVAWVMIERCDFNLLSKGDLVVFRTPKCNILHQLAQLTAAGWITSGLHNSNYDNTRVHPETFVGRVVKTYVLQNGILPVFLSLSRLSGNLAVPASAVPFLPRKRPPYA